MLDTLPYFALLYECTPRCERENDQKCLFVSYIKPHICIQHHIMRTQQSGDTWHVILACHEQSALLSNAQCKRVEQWTGKSDRQAIAIESMCSKATPGTCNFYNQDTKNKIHCIQLVEFKVRLYVLFMAALAD